MLALACIYHRRGVGPCGAVNYAVANETLRLPIREACGEYVLFMELSLTKGGKQDREVFI